MKKRKAVALIMSLMMVLSIFGGSTSAVFAAGGDSDSAVTQADTVKLTLRRILQITS